MSWLNFLVVVIPMNEVVTWPCSLVSLKTNNCQALVVGKHYNTYISHGLSHHLISLHCALQFPWRLRLLDQTHISTSTWTRISMFTFSIFICNLIMLSDDEIDPTIKVWIPFIKFLSGYSPAPRPNSIADSKEIRNPSQPESDIHWNHVQWLLLFLSPSPGGATTSCGDPPCMPSSSTWTTVLDTPSPRGELLLLYFSTSCKNQFLM